MTSSSDCDSITNGQCWCCLPAAAATAVVLCVMLAAVALQSSLQPTPLPHYAGILVCTIKITSYVVVSDANVLETEGRNDSLRPTQGLSADRLALRLCDHAPTVDRIYRDLHDGVLETG